MSTLSKLQEKVRIGKINDDWEFTAHFWAGYAQDLRSIVMNMNGLLRMLVDEERILPPDWVEED